MSRPLIIIGAARSGTNALRDALCELDAFHTWPCDEINYIWRHRNRDHPTDELLPEHARVDVVSFIQRSFEKRELKNPDAVLVEKTCANTLRVPFVRAVVPDAAFVHIVRDAREVVSSAMSRWTAPLDLLYIARKARFLPLSDIPRYGLRYMKNHGARFRSGERRLSTWGPRFTGLDDLVASGTPLHQVCAQQWNACVEAAHSDLAHLPPRDVFEVTYRQLVSEPLETLSAIAEFAEREIDESSLAAAARDIHVVSLGTWQSRLTTSQIEEIESICQPMQMKLGFM